MSRRSVVEIYDISEAYEKVNLETLRPLAKFISSDAPTRKMDLVPFLIRAMSSEEVVRRLYDELGEVPKAAIQEAVANPLAEINIVRFKAKYGQTPDEGSRAAPTRLSLFFPVGWYIPRDLRTILETFVTEPRAVSIDSADELPATVPEQISAWRVRDGAKPESIPLRQRSTAPAALREFATVLRLLEPGKIKVSDKTRKPSQATVDAIGPLLADGDFYSPGDRSEDSCDPGSDLAIRAYAWPCIIQAAGLGTLSGGKLALSPAGRKALIQPARDGIRAAWNKWAGNKLFDEFERIEVIKGKQSARLSAVADRRRAIMDTLVECPAGRWIAIDEFFRFLRAEDADFAIARNEWKLYLEELQYGGFGYSNERTWNLLQGRFIMAMLFEYAATLGLIDIAYIEPQLARNDFRDRWGVDDYLCLSRYDGLKYFRINALGAWCLGQSQQYQPEVILARKTWRVLPNHDVVSSELKPDASDAMFLDKVADRTSDLVWRLDREKIVTAVEDGLAIDAIVEFLEQHSFEPVPRTVQTLLGDLRDRATRLCDKGTVRMIECDDSETAGLLLLDAKLKTLCLPAGERNLIFRTSDEPKVRAQLRKLGYIMPSGD
jgi:Helicase conserved C-terminal domain